ncbi:Cu-binding protein, partial [Massospora cicadina]
KSIGKPLIGGNFALVDQNGNPFTQADLLDKFSIIYFGFTHCPDVCPDELDKMTEVIQKLDLDNRLVAKAGQLQPVFITCDPQRDSPEVVKKYLEDFHPRFIGLTGPIEAVAKACKAYRVYFSRPPKVAPGEDYLVDHSIFFYLMDPRGEFVDCFGKDRTAEEAAVKIREYMLSYDASKN